MTRRKKQWLATARYYRRTGLMCGPFPAHVDTHHWIFSYRYGSRPFYRYGSGCGCRICKREAAP